MPRQKDPNAPKKRSKVFDPNYAPYGMADKPGNPAAWKAAYEHRMLGHDEAVAILDKDNPYTLLGLKQGADEAAVKTAYRRLVATECREAFSLTPDPEAVKKFQKYHAAYSFLMGKK